MSTLMIDGDIVLYQACLGAQNEIEWEPEQWCIETDLRVAKKAADIQLQDILFRSGCKDFVIAISDSANFRKAVYAEYKATRAGKMKPVGYSALKEWMLDAYPSVLKAGLEGDDVMGIFATRPDAGKVVLWSLDKDIATIPGHFLQGKTKRRIEPHEADYYWLCQTLAGDAVDNYPGCKGIGMKTAEKLLGLCGPLFNPDVAWASVVLPAFIKAGFTEDYALSQARVARILRFSDWDNEKQEPILWTPSQ